MTGQQDRIEPRRGNRSDTAESKPIFPKWLAFVFLAVCLVLIPQIISLSSSLRELEVANHWRTVWIGLDVAEALAFLLTAWLLLRGSIFVAITASMAAALLWLDAWFDVLTSLGRESIATAANLAVFLEVPLGMLCLYVAFRRLTVHARGTSELMCRRDSKRDLSQ